MIEDDPDEKEVYLLDLFNKDKLSDSERKGLVALLKHLIEDLEGSSEKFLLHTRSFVGQRLSMLVEMVYDYRGWINKIPNLKFDAGWEVRVVPPFQGALARFLIYRGEAYVSVYFDAYQVLGMFPGPHWELYPDSEGDNQRISVNDPDELIKQIRLSLDAQDKNLQEANAEEVKDKLLIGHQD